MSDHVVCIGLATLDTIFAVPRHPAADDRVVASDMVTAGGGPAATAAVTLARLDIPVFFVGEVGDDPAGDVIRDGLEREGVDIRHLALWRGASPQSSILVGEQGRAIVTFRGTLPPIRLERDAVELCREAAFVHVDHLGYAAAPTGVRLSIDGGNPIDELELAGVALYAPTETALEARFGTAQAALDAGAELVVVTRGDRGSIAYSADGIDEAPAHPVDVVSTLGAGDVFHGALVAALVKERPLADALAFANKAAALSCRALDGRSAIPTPEEVVL